MRYWTYDEIKAKVESDLGIEQEEFVSASELLGYCNEGIDEAEAEIHTIYEDYFLTKKDIFPLIGFEDYTLPTNIYANKLRGAIFTYQDLIYPLRRVRFNDMFNDIASTNHYDSTTSRFRYLITNASAAAGVTMQLVPVPESYADAVIARLATPPLAPSNGDAYLVIADAVDAWVGQENKIATWDGVLLIWTFRDPISKIKLWFLRNANRLVLGEDVCDIPEFVYFVIQFMKMRIYEKEGSPNATLAATQVEQLRQKMVTTLTAMIDDGDTEIEKDLSIYEDMTYGLYENTY